jgi:hypothetical protein
LIGQFFPGDLPKFEELSKEIEPSLRFMSDRWNLPRGGSLFICAVEDWLKGEQRLR